MPKLFSKIRSAAIDGRALNPIFRKVQLKHLHDALSANASKIQDAIAADTNHTPAEVQLEYFLGMRHLTQAYTSLDPSQALHDEHSLARNQNSPHHREAVGIVLIHDPSQHAFFSCLLSALIPALAAGNCIIVQTPQSLLLTPRLVLDIIAGALDDDIFTTTHAPVSDADVNHPHIRVVQSGSANDDGPRPAHHLVSEPEMARVVAVVERDADVDAAAQEVVRARFALRGRAPYAVDLVLVNEWVRREFLEAVVRCVVRFAAEEGGRRTGVLDKGQGGGLLEMVRAERGVNVLSWSSAGAVVDVEDRLVFN